MDFATKLRRRNYVTPRHFLDFINTYLKLLVEKKNFINSRCARLSGGNCKICLQTVLFLLYFFINNNVNRFNNILKNCIFCSSSFIFGKNYLSIKETKFSIFVQ